MSQPTRTGSKGTLFGVGLGPGDPELVTVKAARVIGAADVVAYHSAGHGRSIAQRCSQSGNRSPCSSSVVSPNREANSSRVEAASAVPLSGVRGAGVRALAEGVAGEEVGLAAGEPPARRGYPPSVFAALPRLLERGGTSARGSITAIYTVLVEGGDLDEPVADETRGILDGHVVLDRELAARGRWPAIDPLRSLSRVMDRVVDASHVAAARALLAHLATYEAKRDLVLLGAYERGQDRRLDAALARIDAIEAFLGQDAAPSPLEATRAALDALG